MIFLDPNDLIQYAVIQIYFVNLWNAVVRGENARRKYMSMRRSCTVSAPITVDIDNKLLAIVYLQSGNNYPLASFYS